MQNGKFLKISYLYVIVLFSLGLQAQTVTVSNTSQFLNALDNIASGASTTEIVLEANTYTIPSTINLTS